MAEFRIKEHPILPVKESEKIKFYWDKQPMFAQKGEMIASALFANGVRIFGHHAKDGSAQGIYCANGQCAKCTVIANGVPVKSCMTEVKENMIVESVEGLPELPDSDSEFVPNDIENIEVDVLIIGGGPAGLSAAIELGKRKIDTLVVDDKNKLGGKLVLQTHKFFGSVEDSYAGTRGIEIGDMLAEKVASYPEIKVWTNSTALYAFIDKKVGILKNDVYKLVTPKIVLNAAGAREKFLRFSGNTLAGIYGAGAFQTLVNRDLVKPTNKLFIVGGGNVGLIAGYHALQAGIDVVGLIEAMPKVGGYKVHADKLKRLGVPIYTSHTILSANGDETVSSVTIAEIDSNFNLLAGTEKTFECDTILIAVGLESVSEFAEEAKKAGLKVFGAGDASEIAEASSAMFNGKIAGINIANELKQAEKGIPDSWFQKAEILKKEPGKLRDYNNSDSEEGVMPIIHCLQEIPCNPCTTVCPTDAIQIDTDPIMGLPDFKGKCIGCAQCVAACPGLAITLVDYRKDKNMPEVTLPYEVYNHKFEVGDEIKVVDIEGEFLDKLKIEKIKFNKARKVQLIKVKSPKNIAKKIAGFQIQNEKVTKPLKTPIIPKKRDDDSMVCLCERVTTGEIRKLISKGVTDINQIKAITRMGMGPCGAKTCDNLVKQIFREEGIPQENIEDNKRRPVFIEVPLIKFADGLEGGKE